MKFLKLFNQTIIRDLVRNPTRTLLTLTGVALGIAVVVAVQLANDRAIGSFSDSMDLLNGGADLQIAANGRPLDENLIGELSWVWDVGAMTAIVEGRLQRVAPGDQTLFGQESIPVFGVDLLSDVPFRTREADSRRSRLAEKQRRGLETYHSGHPKRIHPGAAGTFRSICHARNSSICSYPPIRSWCRGRLPTSGTWKRARPSICS